MIDRRRAPALHPPSGYAHATVTDRTPMSALVGVTALGFRGRLVELELTAALA